MTSSRSDGDLIGTHWHNLGGAGAPAGGIVTVDRVEDDIAYGHWDDGRRWAEGLHFLTEVGYYERASV